MSLKTSQEERWMTRNPVVTFVVGAVFGSVIAAASLNALQSQVDPVKQSPKYYTIRIDNDRVRVLEYHLPSGQREPMHSHPPGVVFITSDARLRTMLPNGSVSEASFKAGEVHWRDATTHAAENMGTTEFTALAVELKPCGNTR
jgi:beta-alanine degradation protein BauB